MIERSTYWVNKKMTKQFYNNDRIIIETTDELILPNFGLSLLGKLASSTNMSQRMNQLTIAGDNQLISNSDIILSMTGLIAQGTCAYEEINAYKEDPSFSYLLQHHKTPSKERLRQRMDKLGRYEKSQIILHESSIESIQQFGLIPTMKSVILKKKKGGKNKTIPVSLELPYPMVPLDIDVSPFDNSGSNKEGVERTYKGYDGYSPNFAYFSHEGFLLHTELRKGKAHVQLNTPEFLKTAIERAKKLTTEAICVRMDAGNDSKDNLEICLNESIDFVIKRNPRRLSPESLLQIAIDKKAAKTVDRKGKYHYDFKTIETREVDGKTLDVTCAHRLIVREIDKKGNILLFPEIEMELYWTNLDCSVETIIALYHNHALCEQFHSELKSDLDIERLPSGKFETNALILATSAFTYNLLRLMGQQYLNAQKQQSDKTIERKRMRIKSILKHVLYIGAKLVTSARKTIYKISGYTYELPFLRQVVQAFS